MNSPPPRTIHHHGNLRSVAGLRAGAAVVEMAIVLPILMIVVFGTLEVCERMMLRQSATVAAYESVRLAARRTVTADRSINRGLSILEGRNIENAQIRLRPASLQNVASGEEIRVEALVPVRGNTAISYVLPNSGVIRVFATMLRE